MTLPIPLDRAAEATLQEQIYNFIRNQILGGTYHRDMRLPSTRDLADALRISRNTAVLAYQWLISEGYIETRVGAGTYVSDVAPMGLNAEEISPANVSPSDEASKRTTPDILVPCVLPELVGRAFNRCPIDFWYGKPDARQFPAKIWRRIMADEVLPIPNGFVEYPEIGGLAELRQAISDHLAITKGVTASADRVIITAGVQDALNIVGRMFIRKGLAVAVESPGYAPAVSVFEDLGAQIQPCTIDRQGMVVDSLAAQKPTLIYTTPSHQFPTGIIMSPERRKLLLLVAEQAGAYIIEDDYDGEVIYDRPPLAALAALDRDRRVIYLGTFSKTLGAGIRTGYMVVPTELAMPVAAVKTMMSYGHPWLEQKVLATYIATGSFRSHLRRIRTLYRSRRDATIHALVDCFGVEAEITGHEAGFHLLCRLPESLPDATIVRDLARGAGVGLHTPADVGAYEHTAPPGPERRLIFGYGALTVQQIAQGMATVKRVLARHQASPERRSAGSATS